MNNRIYSISSPLHPLRRFLFSKRRSEKGILSQQDLSRIVAEMVG